MRPVQPGSLSSKKRTSRTSSQTHAESPLRKTSFADDSGRSGNALESEGDDDHVHVMPPPRRFDKVGGAGYDPPTEDLGPEGGNTEEQGGWIHERGTGTPILASDEIRKHPAAEYMQPAVSPAQQMREDEYYQSGGDSDHVPTYHSRKKSSGGSRSRPSSRPTSFHSHHGLSRFISHDESGTGTPLEEIEEYEPLFKDDEKDLGRKPVTAADKMKKRPDLDSHRFPSKDIWEDTPTSLQLHTTVETPEQEAAKAAQSQSSKGAASAFEHPDKELARKGEITEPERLDFLSDPATGLAKPKFRERLQHEDDGHGRPGVGVRFPSQDVWEDTPDSLRLETTVGEQMETQKASAAPFVPARPTRSREGAAAQPSIPLRPQRARPEQGEVVSPTLDQQAPGIPAKAKPQIPPRPSKTKPEMVSPTEASGSTAEPAAKTKPAVPARPAAGSSKFASIKAGFMNDLNSRLQRGPDAQKPTEEETPTQPEEKLPLADARKSRARGPARRKPAASPSPLADVMTPAHPSKPTLRPSKPQTLFSISDTGALDVLVPEIVPTPAPSRKTTAHSLSEIPTASPLARNTAGESLQPRSETPKIAAGALASGANAEADTRAREEESGAKRGLTEFEVQRIGHAGDVPEVPDVDDEMGSASKTAVDEKSTANTTASPSESREEVGRTEAQKEDIGAPLTPQASDYTTPPAGDETAEEVLEKEEQKVAAS